MYSFEKTVELRKSIVLHCFFFQKLISLITVVFIFLSYRSKCKIIFLLILVILSNTSIVHEINWKKYRTADLIIPI